MRKALTAMRGDDPPPQGFLPRQGNWQPVVVGRLHNNPFTILQILRVIRSGGRVASITV